MIKAKSCKVCQTAFTPFMQLALVCSPVCALTLGLKKTSKQRNIAIAADKRETKFKLEKLKSRSQWAKEAQQSFNAWVRLRDHDQPCISCGRRHTGQYHAGHLLSVGARPELRFEPLNVHKQCSACNLHLAGNVILYRSALVKKLGNEIVDWLEGPHEPKKYTIDDLKAIKTCYAARTKKLKELQE